MIKWKQKRKICLSHHPFLSREYCQATIFLSLWKFKPAVRDFCLPLQALKVIALCRHACNVKGSILRLELTLFDG